jgi:hypothetical protein
MKTVKEEISEKRRKSKWWRRFWVGIAISVSVLIIAQYAAYLLGYIDLFKLFGGVLVLLLTIPLTYTVWYIQTRYQHSKTVHVMNKIAFIMAGACLAFPITLFATAFIIWAIGAAPPTSYLGPWPTLILLMVVPMIIGALIGYWIGRRRNYRPFL